MPLDVERLRVLAEVVHAGSIAAAAKRMGYTASALSQQLAKLEREVGDRLVDRGPAGVRPTATGAVLVAHAERVLGELRDAEDAVRDARRRPVERVGLGTFASAGKAIVPGALAAFRRAHPRVRLALHDIEPPAGYGMVTAGDLDLLITHAYPDTRPPPATRLRREHLMTDPLRVVLPAGHPVGAGPLKLADLAGQEWISGAPGVANRVALEAAADRAGVTLRIAYETTDYAVTLALIQAGIGAALVPETSLRDATTGDCVIRDLAEPLRREILVVHRPRPRPVVADMVALLRAAATAAARRALP